MAEDDSSAGSETPLVDSFSGVASTSPLSPRDTKIVRIVALVVLGLGVSAVILAGMLRKPAPRDIPIDHGALVEVQALRKGSQALVVRAQGSVIPAHKVAVHAEVNGRIEWVSPALVPGGRFKEGDELVRINSRDYQLRVDQARASLEQVQYQLQIEQSRKQVAEREWQILGSQLGASEEGKAVALREPQLKAAKAAVEAAQSALQLAEVALGRSTVRAPFASFVQSYQADVGQYVAPQSPLATLIGIEEFWVQVAVPLDELERIQVPGWNVKKGEGSLASVTMLAGGRQLVREGRVTGLMGDLDAVGRMARLLVSIQHPLEPATTGSARPTEIAPFPLLIGSYVNVEINTGTEEGLVEVPRRAVFEGNKIYVFGKDSTLEVREVDTAWARPKSLLVRGGIEAGEEVIVTAIPSPLVGMKLRRASSSSVAKTQIESGSAPKTTKDDGKSP